MGAYLYPLRTALVQFPVIALLLTVPYMLYYYRRFGSISLVRSVIVFSFFFYLLCAFYLTLLPLPSPDSVAHLQGPFMQLQPFHFIRVFLTRTPLDPGNPHTYLPAMRRSEFFQPVFNILLTLPFGVYMGYYFRQSRGRTLLFSFLLSLFFELTQLTGVWGVYARPYRLFDVDDLMLNTLGGYVGHRISPYLTSFLPSRRAMDKSALQRGRHASYPRRLTATAVDLFCLLLLSGAVGRFAVGGWLRGGAYALCMYLLYFVGLGTLFRGRTPGKALVRLRTVAVPPGRLPLALSLLAKYLLLYAPYAYLRLTARLFPLLLGRGWTIALLVSYAAIFLLLLIDFIRSFRRSHRLYYERISRTQNISTI